MCPPCGHMWGPGTTRRCGESSAEVCSDVLSGLAGAQLHRPQTDHKNLAPTGQVLTARIDDVSGSVLGRLLLQDRNNTACRGIILHGRIDIAGEREYAGRNNTACRGIRLHAER